MSKSLFEEAVADANKLRELAEETAKNKVVEAVMPQIRDLVNRKILGEDIEAALEDDITDVVQDFSKEDLDVEDPAEVEIGHEAKPSVAIAVDGDVEINLEIEEEEDDDDFVMDEKMAEALTRLLGNPTMKTQAEKKLEKLEESVKKLSIITESVERKNLSSQQIKRLNLCYLHCVRESIRLKSEMILTEGTTQERLERRLTETIKEIRKMSKSNRRNIFDFLFEGEDEKKKMEELEEAELSLELSADEQEELAGAEDVDAVGDALEDILGDLEVSLGAEAGEEPADEEPADEEGEEGEEAGEEEEEEELEIEEGDHMEGSYAEADADETYEIDENMLRRELSSMLNEDDAVDADPALNHGGEELGHVLLDISEDDLINALADELGDAPSPDTSGAPVAESRRRRHSRTARALREARAENQKYRSAITELKRQLVEMNLFNAKLLYANKLMQNKDLTMKQQKAIVEALDNAKTLREAKLLFKSLTESLNRRARSNKLNEGSLRTIGSSSRSTRSAAPANNGAEVDRWAVLAGLKED